MRLSWIALACLVLSACSAMSYDQDGGDLSRLEVEFISSRMRDATEKEFPLIKHKLVTHYVDGLGQAIVAHNKQMPPLPYEFRVLKTNEVLAFSLPGGVVYISLGLIRAVDLEGQLVAAISHELAHQQLNHQLIVWRQKINAHRGEGYVVDFNGDWKQIFLSNRGALFLERKMEEEADNLGPLLMYNAGFDPRVYSTYLQLLRNLELSHKVQVASLLSLHPPIAERAKWGLAGISKLPPKRDPNLSSPTFQQIKAILKETEKRSKQPSTQPKKQPEINPAKANP